MLKAFVSLLILAPVLLSSGCGSAKPPSKPVNAQAASPGGSANAAIDADMVAAVSAGGSGPPISLKFRLETRPVVGSPAQLVLALVPTPGLGIAHIHASLQAEDGLQLSPRTFDIDAPQDGVTLAQDVTVVPQQAGLLSLSAVVVVDYGTTSIARTYVIPLIAAANAS
jgi:hypothetical protein